MPESPRFLISKKRFDEARTVFKWIGSVNGLDAETTKYRLSEIIFEGEDCDVDEDSLMKDVNLKISDSNK